MFADLGCSELSRNKTLLDIGVCNDELNQRYCFYDNGDCCLNSIDDSKCEDCICHIVYNEQPKISEHSQRWDWTLRSGRSLHSQKYSPIKPPNILQKYHRECMNQISH